MEGNIRWCEVCGKPALVKRQFKNKRTGKTHTLMFCSEACAAKVAAFQASMYDMLTEPRLAVYQNPERKRRWY